MNAREIAQKRKAEIEYSQARIERKLEDMPGDPRADAWEKRLAEYAKSMELIEFTIKTGREVRLKGSGPGITIDPPAGNLSMEGK